MPYEGDGREPQLHKFLEKGFIDGTGAGTRANHAHHNILTLHQSLPDLLCLRSSFPDDGRTTHTRMIACDDRKDLNPAEIACLEHSLSGTYIRILAPFPGSDDHQFKVLSPAGVNPFCKCSGDVHFCHAFPDSGEGLDNGFISDAREPA